MLLRHPAVREVAIVGMPHEQWGESPHAFVVLQTGATASEAEIKQFARDRMAHFKVPQWVTFVDELPKTATGKVQKFVLRGRRTAMGAKKVQQRKGKEDPAQRRGALSGFVL